jgi:integrase
MLQSAVGKKNLVAPSCQAASSGCPQGMRHANATLLDAVGTPLGTVQALLGHSSSEITREVYLHSIPADARAAVEEVEELLNRPKLTQVAENWENGSWLIQ